MDPFVHFTYPSVKIEDLNRTLFEQDIKIFKPKGTLNNFLKKRPNLFSVINDHVLSKLRHDQNAALKEKKLEVNNNMKKTVREAEKSPTGIKTEDIKIDFKQLKPIERDILALMGDKKWEIELLETQVTVEKSCSSIGKGQLTNFLKNRPHLFVITDVYVHSHLKEIGALNGQLNKRINRFEKKINRTILKTVRQNPEADCSRLFKLLPFPVKRRFRIYSVQVLVKFLSERNLLPNQDRIIQEQINLVPKPIESSENFRNTSPIDVIGITESILEI